MSTNAQAEQKKKIPLEEKVDLPEGVSTRFENGQLITSGPLGTVRQDYSKIPVSVKVNGNSVSIKTVGSRRKDRSVIRTASSLLRNATEGVTKGFQYRLKVIFAHFPVTVKVQGKTVVVENFYGERSPRIAEIIGDTKVEVQGEDLIVSGPSVQDVGQTAANIEQATTVRRKDQRVFLDGVYVYARAKQ